MSRHAGFLIFSFYLSFPLKAFSEALPSEKNTNSIAVVFGDVHCAFDELPFSLKNRYY